MIERKNRRPEYFFTARTDMVEMIPYPVQRVLDVGCGGGATGALLRRKGVLEVFGIELEEEAANAAKPYYTRVIVGDAEKVELPFPDSYFDCILYGDILEHLLYPWLLLKTHSRYLRMGGVIIVSLPNVRHYRILKRLILSGRWDYVEEGILDITHLRFFTLKNAKKMIEDAGFRIQGIRRKISAVPWLKILNSIIGGVLSDFLTRQYIICAKKIGEPNSCQR
jgi:SAM-dependent methyltransferase